MASTVVPGDGTGRGGVLCCPDLTYEKCEDRKWDGTIYTVGLKHRNMCMLQLERRETRDRHIIFFLVSAHVSDSWTSSFSEFHQEMCL